MDVEVTYTALANAGGVLKLQWESAGNTVTRVFVDGALVDVLIEPVSRSEQKNQGRFFKDTLLDLNSHFRLVTQVSITADTHVELMMDKTGSDKNVVVASSEAEAEPRLRDTGKAPIE